jgi:hypothetical protein
MTAANSALQTHAHTPGLRMSAERLRCLLLWLTGISGAVVFIEPSPYEVISILTLLVFAVGGLAVSAALLPFALLLLLINIGYTVSASDIVEDKAVVIWTATSWYLAATALFFAVMLGNNTTSRLSALANGWLAAGVIASVAAIVGYSRLFPSANEFLLLYERARGTFKDPNVLGAFLIFPTMWALQRVFFGRLLQAIGGIALLALFATAILLSFSRGAWAQVVLAALIVGFLSLMTTGSPALRLRIVLLGIGGTLVLIGLLAALVLIDAVWQLFHQRAEWELSYDLGSQGRFARHILGAIFALDEPFGIGPLQFSHHFPEDPHNSYLNAFMSGGWLSGVCYPALVATTLIFGLRAIFVATPWRQDMIAVYASYVGVVAESVVIDSDHWRHAYLLLGATWGLIAATRTHSARARNSAVPAGTPLSPGSHTLALRRSPA